MIKGKSLFWVVLTLFLFIWLCVVADFTFAEPDEQDTKTDIKNISYAKKTKPELNKKFPDKKFKKTIIPKESKKIKKKRFPWLLAIGCVMVLGIAAYFLLKGSKDDSSYEYPDPEIDLEFVTKWGNDGGGIGQFYDPHGIAADNSGFIYVADTQNNRIQKFTSEGVFVTQWGTYSPFGIAIKGTYMYLSDWEKITKYTLGGNLIKRWDAGFENFSRMYGIAVDNSNSVYVSQVYGYQIKKFTTNGVYLISWGNQGSGNGQFDLPHGIGSDSSGFIYVADFSNKRIQKFTKSGDFLLTIDYVSNPQYLTFDEYGYLYITRNQVIKIFDSNYSFIRFFGEDGTGDGQFKYPRGIAIDNSGYIYVVDSGNSRIQKFRIIYKNTISSKSKSNKIYNPHKIHSQTIKGENQEIIKKERRKNK